MSGKVRIPFTFVVRKVTWRPAGEALPEAPQSSVLTGLNGQALPLDAEIFPEPGVLDALTEQGKREYYEEEAVKADEARRQAREAEEARWEPMPTSGGASRLTASLYGNLRRARTATLGDTTSSETTAPPDESDRQAGAANATSAVRHLNSENSRLLELASDRPGLIQWETDPDSPFAATPGFVSRFRGSPEEVDVAAMIEVIGAGGGTPDEYLRATDRVVQLPDGRRTLYAIYRVGKTGRLAHASGSQDYYYSPDHYGTNPDTPHSWIAMRHPAKTEL